MATEIIQPPFKILPLPPYLKIEQVMENFGLDRHLIYRLLKNGTLIGSRPQGRKRWHIETASVFKYLKKHQNRRTPQDEANQSQA